MDTRGYTGRVRKSATVYSNDLRSKSSLIALEAFIRPLISITPTVVFLEGRPGQVMKGIVEIKGGMDRELRLEPAHFDLQGKVVYTLEEIEPGKMYRVSFSNVAGLSGIAHGQLRLNTSYPEKPVVSIRIRCRFGS
jgi:hypothetical protein